METNRTRNLILIALLLAAVIYTLIPNNPGIHIFGFNRDLETKEGLDLTGGLSVVLEVDLPADTPVDPAEVETARQILENRANALGVSEVVLETAGARRIVGEFPGARNTEEVIEALKQTGVLAFVPLGSNYLPDGTVINVDLTNTVTPAEANGTPVSDAAPAEGTDTDTAGSAVTDENVPTYRPLMTGSALKEVGVTQDQLGQPVVSFVLKDNAVEIFKDYTTMHQGEFLAIVLDGTVISAPRVNSPIDQGEGVIEGNFTYDSANALAVQLRYGSLPVPFKVVESRQVGATLGQDSVQRSIVAGVIGLLMVMVFMAVYYRLPGVVADVALLIYAATTFAIFKLIPVTLTLPGIAGFVLSIGVAVDANVLIFSRLKEELRAGRPLRSAIDIAWSRAWLSIRDSNIASLITCVILYWYGSAFGASIVKGFALTLVIGVIVSLFTAITVTRTILHLVLDKFKFGEHPRLFMAETPQAVTAGLPASRGPRLDLVSRRYLYFAISLLVIIPGMIALATWGLPLAIDFTGGSMLEARFASQAPQPAEMIQFLDSQGITGSRVQSSEGGLVIIRMKEVEETQKNQLIAAMSDQFNSEITVERFDTVGPSISQEVASRAAGAVGIASLGILLYISFAFRGVAHSYRYGIAAIVAMLHDVAVVIGVAAILGHFFTLEVDSLFLTALLTVIGFSVHDTIVVFDRIRENANIYRRVPYTAIVNHAIVQTLDRSLNTSLTVMFTLLAMALFGGITIRYFVTIMLIGIFSGTYSSIFNAAQILVVWENKEWRNWFRRPAAAAEAEQKA